MQSLESIQHTSINLISPANFESELNLRVKKTIEKCTKNIYSIANEPSLACYCIQEHLLKSGLQLTEKREESRKIEKKLSDAIIDVDFTIESIDKIKNSSKTFINTQELIKNAIFCKQQITYDETKRRRNLTQLEKDHSVNDFRKFNNNKLKNKPNAFKRFSNSFEASLEGIATSASADFKEFKAALSHISQLKNNATKEELQNKTMPDDLNQTANNESIENISLAQENNDQIAIVELNSSKENDNQLNLEENSLKNESFKKEINKNSSNVDSNNLK